MPSNLILILLVLATFLLWSQYFKAGRKLLTFILFFLIIIAMLPIGEWLISPLENQFSIIQNLPNDIDGIIVLSGSEDAKKTSQLNQVQVGDAIERDLAFMQLARHYQDVKLIFSGGTGYLSGQQYKAADVAKRLFKEQGLDVNKIIFERQSRNTYENALYSKQLANPKPGEKWILITTAWHMPRSMGIFCKLNWPMIAYPVDYTTIKNNTVHIEFSLNAHLKVLDTSVKEWIGLITYYVTGKTDKLLSKGCL